MKNSQTILTIHGCPGDFNDWPQLEGSYGQFSRWINFFVPGFDGQPEIRGDYKGGIEDICKMIVLLLDQKKIAKVVMMPHSMGGFIYFYFAKIYSSRLAGYIYSFIDFYFRAIYMATPPNWWYIGFKTFHTISVYSKHLLIDNLNDEKLRLQIYNKFYEDKKEVYFSMNN